MRLLLLLCFLCSGLYCQAQYFDTLHIHYPIGDATLPAAARRSLDSLATQADGQKLLIYSYADYLGSERANLHLSERRANTVKRYLLEKGIREDQVMECTGLGQVAGSGGNSGDPLSRRTDIFIRRKTTSHNPSAAKDSPPAPAQRQGRIVISDTTRVTRIDIEHLEVDATIKLNNIEFYPGEVRVLPSAYPEIENLYNVLYDHPSLKIRLEGHVCCCVYPDGYFENTPTWGLSVARAKLIYDHLVKRGIAPERMQYKGFGRTHPIVENERTVEEGKANRRVEVRILAK